MGTVDQRSALLSDGYSIGLAAWALQHDMELSMVDPSAGLDREAEERMNEFADSENAALLYAIVETMNQADISKMDGESSQEDWLLSTDPDVVRFRLDIAAELAGIELTEDQLDALTAQIVTTAVFGAATDGDQRDAVDDQFDENAAIEESLDDGAPTEHDFEVGDNPTEAEQYVQAWLEAQWRGNPGMFDYAKMILLPDFAVMNPWSDEFHPGWALLEVIGIIPFTKAGKLLSLGRRKTPGESSNKCLTTLPERMYDGERGAGDDCDHDSHDDE